MTDETTSEQLAEIEGEAADTPATEYTPPEGWRVLAVGEVLQAGDQIVQLHDGKRFPTERAGQYVCETQRYIRPIEPESQPEPVQVCEGRWRTRGGEVKNIRPCEPLKGAYYVWPWTDGIMTFQDNGLHQGSKESPNDLLEYLGPIEEQSQPQAEPEPEPDTELQIRLLKEANDSQAETIGRLQAAIDERADLGGASQTRVELQARIRELEAIRDYQAAAIEELRSEVSYVQRLLGESRQRVTHLEDLVTSLRTIQVAQEKAFTAAGKENTALRNQLLAVKTELASVAADRQRLQIELDAAQQVPADSPELRQLRSDLAEVTLDRDQYKDAYTRLSAFVETVRETAKAEAVEAIAEWLQAFRGCNNPALALLLLEALPAIMRSITGLNDEEIE